MILMGMKLLEHFTKKNCKKKKNQKKFRTKTVINRKGDELYVKWEGHNNSFNS